THAAMVADGDADHGAAIHGRCHDLVRRFKVRVQTPIGVDAGVQRQADIVAVGQNAIHERPAQLGELFLSFGIPKQVGVFLADGNVGMHTAAVDPNNRLGQEAGSHAHLSGYLTTNQLIELNLVGGLNSFAITVVHFEL